MEDIKQIIVQWRGRVVFKMVKKKDWVVTINESLRKTKKKPSLAYRRLKRMHARSR